MIKSSPDSISPALMEWTAASVSGSKKAINDDSWIAFASNLDGATFLEEQGSRSLTSQDLIFVVSDGMGGGNAGNVASDLMTKILSGLIPETFEIEASGGSPDYLAHLEGAVHDIHDAINRTAELKESRKGMAATLTLAWFTSKMLYFINVGDSRLYLYRESETMDDGSVDMKQLSQDHTFAWRKMSRGEITERQFRRHPRRSVLYQVMGGGHPRIRPYSVAIPYQVGDRFLLCSDGLIDGLWDKHIQSAFDNNLESTSSLAQALMSQAVSNDGKDDTTLIALTVREDKS